MSRKKSLKKKKKGFYHLLEATYRPKATTYRPDFGKVFFIY